jgi:hypothetical protein
VTGAELEALTDGSNADSLHTHAGLGGSISLDDAYNNGSSITVDASPVTLNPTGSKAPLQLNPMGSAPSSGLASGQLVIIGNDLYLYDSTRTKWLSVASFYIGAGVNSTNVKNSYLKGYNGTSQSADVGWLAPWNGTICAIMITADSTSTNTIRIRANGSDISGAAVSYSNNKKNYSITINSNFSAGDVLSFYCDGSDNGTNRPQCWAIIKRRI